LIFEIKIFIFEISAGTFLGVITYLLTFNSFDMSSETKPKNESGIWNRIFDSFSSGNTELQPKNYAFILALAIVSGFSDRFLITAIEKMVKS
jgi:hypothetical protein